MQPTAPTGFHTVDEPDPSGRLPRRNFLDAVPAAQQVGVEEKPPPPRVEGREKLIDGSVPRRFGPGEEADAAGWALGGDLAELQLLPQGRVAVRPAFIAPARPDAAQLDAACWDQLARELREALDADGAVTRYRNLRSQLAVAHDAAATAREQATQAHAEYEALLGGESAEGLVGKLTKAAARARSLDERATAAAAVVEALEGQEEAAQAQARERADVLGRQRGGALATALEAELAGLRTELLAAARPVVEKVLVVAECLSRLRGQGARALAGRLLGESTEEPRSS
jgi:hypothetical protein